MPAGWMLRAATLPGTGRMFQRRAVNSRRHVAGVMAATRSRTVVTVELSGSDRWPSHLPL